MIERGERTEACHRNAGVVHYHVDTLWMFLLQKGRKICDALRLRYVQTMVTNRR